MNLVLVDSLNGIGPHLFTFFLSVLILGFFVWIFITVTPYREISLIKQGNTAAAISLGGCVLGFSIPLAKAVAQSTGLLDMLIWSSIALFSQLIAYGLTRFLFKNLTQDVNTNQPASAIFLFAASIAIGLLNAAGMTL